MLTLLAVDLSVRNNINRLSSKGEFFKRVWKIIKLLKLDTKDKFYSISDTYLAEVFQIPI